MKGKGIEEENKGEGKGGRGKWIECRRGKKTEEYRENM